MIVGRKKDGDGERNKWSEVKHGDFRREILEVSYTRGIDGKFLISYMSRMDKRDIYEMTTFVAHEFI